MRIIFCPFIRVSTKRQIDDIASQRTYHTKRRNTPKMFCGSAWSDQSVIIWLQKKFTSKCSKGECIQADCFSFDRFSRNVNHCDSFRNWLKIRGYKFILTVNGSNYNYLNNEHYRKIRDNVSKGQEESDIKSERSKRMWALRRQNQSLPLRIELNEAEKYFIAQIVHTADESGVHIAASNLHRMLRSCGVKNINIVDIKKWRRELPLPAEEVSWEICPISDLAFATCPGMGEINWQIFERFIPSITVAKNVADTYDYLDAICRKETLPEYQGLSSMETLDEAIEEIEAEDDTDSMSDHDTTEKPSAAPAADIVKYLQDLISMKERGFITDEEFNLRKAKIY